MASATQEVGSRPEPFSVSGVSIDTVKTITLPNALQRVKGGVMTLILSVEGQNARFTIDGLTTPSAAVGVLLVNPGLLTVRGERTISVLKIIGVAAGGTINYCFTVDDIS